MQGRIFVETPYVVYCTTVLPQSVKPKHLCHCGCGGELPPFVDHASRATRYLPGHVNPDIFQRFEIDQESDCWIWQGKPTANGHGQICVNRITRTAHRVFYERIVGPVPEGYTLHHTCDNKLCVNPDHLDVMTHAEHRRLHAFAKWELQRADSSLHLIGRYAVDAYTSRRQTTAKQMTSAIAAPSEACLLSGETEDDPTPAALAPVAGAGLGGGR